MRVILFIPIFMLFAGQVAYTQKSDSATIVQLLKNDYATMGSLDIKSHLANITTGYLLIENGEIWDISMEIDSIYKKYANRIILRTDSFHIITLKSTGDMAYAVWHLKSEFKENSNLRIKEWEESGVFRKEKGQWKIALIHSTPSKQ